MQGLEGLQDSILSTVKDKLLIPAEKTTILEKGMPFNSTSEDERKVISNTTEMQSVGFGLTAIDMNDKCLVNSVALVRKRTISTERPPLSAK
jgi:hypothetical protein